jgi:hypothetical protein
MDTVFRESAVDGTEMLPGGAGSIRFRFQDINYLVLALEALRRIDGEKHLIFVSQQPLPVIAASPLEERLSRAAGAARVAIHLLNTGGVPAERISKGRVSTLSRVAPSSDVSTIAANQRSFASSTGGLAVAFQQPSGWLRSLERITRLGYLLGYYPRPPGGDDVRRIEIRVNRPDAHLLFRRTFDPGAIPLRTGDLRSALTDARITTAAETLLKASLDRRRWVLPPPSPPKPPGGTGKQHMAGYGPRCVRRVAARIRVRWRTLQGDCRHRVLR